MNQMDFIMEEPMTMIDDLAKRVNDFKYSDDKSLLLAIMSWQNKDENWDDNVSRFGISFHLGASKRVIRDIFTRLNAVGQLVQLWGIDPESTRDCSIKETHEIFKFLDDNNYIGHIYLRMKEDLTTLQDSFYGLLEEDKNSNLVAFVDFAKHRMTDCLNFIKAYDRLKFFEDGDEGFYESGKAFYDRLCEIENPTSHECLTIFQKFATLLLLYVRNHFHDRLIKPISDKYRKDEEDQ